MKQPPRQKWADQIRIARLTRRLRQVEVAELAGVSQTAVSDAERGYGLGTIRRIAHALDIQLLEDQ